MPETIAGYLVATLEEFSELSEDGKYRDIGTSMIALKTEKDIYVTQQQGLELSRTPLSLKQDD